MLKASNYSRLHAINRNNEKKILIVDDNSSILKAGESMIEHWGYQVCCATNGKDAVTMYKKEKPDLVLMDIKMPKLDGYDAFMKIHKKHPDAKVILMTAYTNDPRIKDAVEQGILHVFGKPFSLRELKDKLSQHLGRGKPTRI